VTDSIFINYRHAEMRAYAMWLFNQLRLWFDTEALLFGFSRNGVNRSERKEHTVFFLAKNRLSAICDELE